MSILLDDYSRTIITTANGKHVCVDTRYVPFPLGNNCYETQVFRCNTNGNVVNYINAIDSVTYGNDKIAADIGHANMINKWMKGVVS